MSAQGLLAGPDPHAGMEAATEHVARLGPMPRVASALIETLERSGLRGRGGASFPVATKWHAVAERRRGEAVVLVNGAEGEPLSRKDSQLMEARPHLVLDGALLAAQAVGAREIVLYVGAEHAAAAVAMTRAVGERTEAERTAMRIVRAPTRYVSGEETAAVHFVNNGIALPTSVPPRPYERGVGGLPTLVQNVESLAHVALIARFGEEWFRDGGRGAAAGTALLTLSGALHSPGVVEVAQGTTIGEAITEAGGRPGGAQAVLLGGYFGAWVPAERAWELPVNDAGLRNRGLSLGCAVVSVLGAGTCGVIQTARFMSYLAGESARQCGPCVFGLRAMAEAAGRIASGRSQADDIERLQRWTHLVPGRGACRHPDGAAGFLRSALLTFEEEFAAHHHHRRCREVASTLAQVA